MGILIAQFSKRPVAEYVNEDTVVWQCTSCNCWSRKEFVANDHKCLVCGSKMIEEFKNI